jgi:hypothetical protein
MNEVATQSDLTVFGIAGRDAIFVATERSLGTTAPRVYAHNTDDLHDWMDRMNYCYEDFDISEVIYVLEDAA